jgi:hypothetical protein
LGSRGLGSVKKERLRFTPGGWCEMERSSPARPSRSLVDWLGGCVGCGVWGGLRGEEQAGGKAAEQTHITIRAHQPNPSPSESIKHHLSTYVTHIAHPQPAEHGGVEGRLHVLNPEGVRGPGEDTLPALVPPLGRGLAVGGCGSMVVSTQGGRRATHKPQPPTQKRGNRRTCPRRRPSPARCSRGASARSTLLLPVD